MLPERNKQTTSWIMFFVMSFLAMVIISKSTSPFAALLLLAPGLVLLIIRKVKAELAEPSRTEKYLALLEERKKAEDEKQ